MYIYYILVGLPIWPSLEKEWIDIIVQYRFIFTKHRMDLLTKQFIQLRVSKKYIQSRTVIILYHTFTVVGC